MKVVLNLELSIEDTYPQREIGSQNNIRPLLYKVITTDYFPQKGDEIRDPYFSSGKTVRSIWLSNDATGECTYNALCEYIHGNWRTTSFRDDIKHAIKNGWKTDDPTLLKLLEN